MTDKNFTVLEEENKILKEALRNARNLCFPRKRGYIYPKERLQSIFKIVDRALDFESYDEGK